MTTIWRFRNFEYKSLIPALVEIYLYSGYFKTIISMSAKLLHVIIWKKCVEKIVISWQYNVLKGFPHGSVGR